MLTPHEPYSYRTDPNVPEFDDSGPVVVMDGECALCTTGARLIARFDRKQEFRICPEQSPTGAALLRHYGLDASDPDSWLYLADGRAHDSFDAVVRVGARMGGVARLVAPLGILPRPVQDALYGWMARNRYRLFGRTEMCAVADPALRARLMD